MFVRYSMISNPIQIIYKAKVMVVKKTRECKLNYNESYCQSSRKRLEHTLFNRTMNIMTGIYLFAAPGRARSAPNT